MKRVKIVEGQTHTFDALAKILHTQREQIVDLVSREKHPLPLPVLVEDLDE